jgi:hypothetical protein
MKLTGIEKLAICGQALSHQTFRNRYRFWRYVEERGPVSAAFMAALASLRRGD